MNAPNLAICVAPVIVVASGPASFAGTMESMGRAQGLVRDLIVQCEWIFEKDVEVEASEAVEVEVTEEGSIRAGDTGEAGVMPVASI
jgi:hypothetical protein